MKRSRSALSPAPTLQSVDPIDLRALSDELDLSDMMRRTVISTIDEWAETPVSVPAPTTVVSTPPSLRVPHAGNNGGGSSANQVPEYPHSPVRLWSSIRRLWHAVFPEHQEHQPATLSRETAPETRCAQTPEKTDTEMDVHPSPHVSNPFVNVPQRKNTPRKPRPVSDFFEEDVTDTSRPSQPASKPVTEAPRTPFQKPRQVSDFFEEDITETSLASQSGSELFAEVPQGSFQKPSQVPSFLEPKLADASKPSKPISKPFTEAPRTPFRKSRQVSDFFEEDITETALSSQPASELFLEVPKSPFQKPSQVSNFFERNPADASQPSKPTSKPVTKAPRNPFEKLQQGSNFFGENRTENLQPSPLTYQIFTEVPKNPFRKPRQYTDFFEEDIDEAEVDKCLPTDNELLDLCSRICSPTQQTQRRRITGDPAIDRRLAHLESLRARIRERRIHDKTDEDMMRRRRRQRIIDEQRRIASSLRVQRMAGVPRNVKLPLPTKRSRLAKLKEARASGGVSSPTGLFEMANGFRV